jgi:hypothetical protein
MEGCIDENCYKDNEVCEMMSAKELSKTYQILFGCRLHLHAPMFWWIQIREVDSWGTEVIPMHIVKYFWIQNTK